jgi:hypothetical protein
MYGEGSFICAGAYRSWRQRKKTLEEEALAALCISARKLTSSRLYQNKCDKCRVRRTCSMAAGVFGKSRNGGGSGALP